MNAERFILQASEKQNFWVVTDTENLIVCIFENHNFNENQQFKLLENSKVDVMQLAKISREFGDWLRVNHYDKVF